MPMCPNGHQSTTDDWCEVCGIRMAAPAYGSRPASTSSSSSPASTPPSSLSPPGFDDDVTRAVELCPQCGTPREGVALFCEECRYNFRTRTPTIAPGMPVVQPPTPSPVPPTAAVFPPYPHYDGGHLSEPSQINRPAERLPSESVTITSGSGDYAIDPPSKQSVPPHHDPTTAGSPGRGSSPTAAGSGAGTAWVAVIAADRTYFTTMMARSGPEAESLYFPSFSPSVELPLTGHQVTIGRHRHSTGEAPDIDLARAPEDPGVSHKHAVLVQQPDGSWSVVDQDSTNGTTVNLGEDPIRPYTPVPLGEGDRVHVGAWTTITLKRV